MNISKVAVKRPVATLMCVIVALAFGFISLTNLKVDLLPNMNIPVALVLTTYDGAGSSEIKQLITEPIESSMGTISGIDTISSTSSNGSSMVILKFNDDVDIDLAALDIREKIDLVKGTLPDDADDPMIIKIDINSMSSLQISAFSESMDVIELNKIMEDKISDRLEKQNGVASVSISGGKDQEVQVVIKEEKMRGYGISESTVASVLRAENSNTPMGSVDKGNKNMTVRVSGEFSSIEEIKNIPITTGTGGTVYLRDIAEVNEVYKEASSAAYTNKIPSVNLTIQKQSTANTVNVSAAVLKEIENIKADYPNIQFLVVNDPADYINDSISNVANTAVQGGILAVIVLYIFLRNFKSTLVVGISMPVSIISTFALMYFAGMTLNIMSLGGLVLGIGMLVDSSIVVLESIYKKLEEGEDRFTAAIEGAREVVPSVIASTLTTVGVFLPVVFVQGTIGQMFKDLSLTISFSLAASLVVSITFVPMACAILLKPTDTANLHEGRSNPFTIVLDAIGHVISLIEVGYKKLLDVALNHRRITFVIVVIFILATGSTLPSMGFDFMPQSDEGVVSISASLPKGTKLADTEKVTWKIINKLDNIEEIQDVSFTIGGGSMSVLTGASEDSSSITINLVDKKERDRSSDQVAQQIRKLVQDIPGADITVESSSSSMGSYSSGGAEVMIKGDDMETLESISKDFVEILKGVSHISNPATSVEDATPQMTIKVNRDKASTYGISSSSISSIVRTAIAGSVATTYKIDGDEYDIRIKQDGDKINYITDVENILIPTATGANVPLHELAEIVSDDVPASITREDQETYVSVTANIENSTLSEVNNEISEKLKDYIMPDGYTWEFGGSSDDMTEAFMGLVFALIVGVCLVYMIMAGQFESFAYPFIVMFSIPVAATGGLLGLFLTGSSITTTAFLGVVMLAGVVVNNAIVLIDYTNLLIRERGFDLLQAMKIAGPTRLRPILMSTLTTVLGLIPMMVSQESGAEMMRGLATVVVFGLSLSTLVTLVFIPVIYVSFNGHLEKHREKVAVRKAKKEERKIAKNKLK